MATQEERFALATHFYVRLRRHLGRNIDAVWMSQNEDYAREILRLSLIDGHPELVELVDRYETLIGLRRPAAPAEAQRADPAPGVKPQVAEHYIGALR